MRRRSGLWLRSCLELPPRRSGSYWDAEGSLPLPLWKRIASPHAAQPNAWTRLVRGETVEDGAQTPPRWRFPTLAADAPSRSNHVLSHKGRGRASRRPRPVSSTPSIPSRILSRSRTDTPPGVAASGDGSGFGRQTRPLGFVRFRVGIGFSSGDAAGVSRKTVTRRGREKGRLPPTRGLGPHKLRHGLLPAAARPALGLYRLGALGKRTVSRPPRGA